MKKVIVVSDTHGYTGNFDKVVEENKDAHLLIHLGDVCNDEQYINRKVHYAVKILKGNNDWSYELPEKAVMNIMGHKILATHGHLYNVLFGVERLVWTARELGCDIVLFGHTHVPIVEEGDDLTLVNPGSLSYPRQMGHKPSYVIMMMDEDGTVDYEIKYLEKE